MPQVLLKIIFKHGGWWSQHRSKSYGLHVLQHSRKVVPVSSVKAGLCLNLVSGQQLTGLTRYTGTVCVDSEMVLASCPDTAVIAVEDIRAGANLLSRNCPESYKDLNNTECCSEKPDDCIFR